MISDEKANFIRSLADDTGHIDPQTVVNAARAIDSPIHGEFTLDVNTAAAEHWLDTARNLIRFVKLEVQIERQTVIAPFYVPDPTREPKSRRYVDLSIASRDKAIAQQIMLGELDRIAAAVRRAQQVATVLGLTKQLDDLLIDVVTIKTATERRRDAAAQRAESKRKKKQKEQAKRRKPHRQQPEART